MKKFFLKQLRKALHTHWMRYDKTVPKFQLTAGHLHELEALPDRVELVRRLPAEGVVAEIGVDQGDFSQVILREARPRQLHLVDF